MNKKSLAKIILRQEILVALFTVLLFVIFSVFSDNFFTSKNIRLILQQYSINSICVLGVAIIVILGGIDLSVGAILAIAGAAGGTLVKNNVPIIICFLVAIVIGAICGMINGLIVTKLGIPEIITTIATNFVYRGILVIVTGGFWVNQFPTEFKKIATGRIFGINNVFWMDMILLAAVSFILHKTNIGRKIYAVGTNPDAAEKCGINIDRIKLFGFILCGSLAGFASMLYAGQYGSISTSGSGSTLGTTTLAAALVGGVNFGGIGTLIGASIGMFMITMINNGLVQLKVQEYWIDAITGAIILIALVLNTVNTMKKRSSRL